MIENLELKPEHPECGAHSALTLPYAVNVPRRRSLGLLALASSFALPGLGQWIAGRTRRAWRWLIIWLAINLLGAGLSIVPGAFWGLLLVVPAAVFLFFYMLVDAYRCGVRSHRFAGAKSGILTTVGIVVLAASLFAGPAFLANRWFVNELKSRYVEQFSIIGSSMAPTVQAGDRVLAHKRVEPQRWSIVVIRHPQYSGPVISRVVGLPGETVEVVAPGVKIDGRLETLPQGVGPYISDPLGLGAASADTRKMNGCQGNPIRLGDDEYYVLGDNSARALDARLWDVSADGRQLGALPRDRIVGTVTALYRAPFELRGM